MGFLRASCDTHRLDSSSGMFSQLLAAVKIDYGPENSFEIHLRAKTDQTVHL